MQLTVLTWNDQCVSIQVDASTSVADVKAILEAETGIPIAQQALVYGTRLMQDSQTVGACGVTDGDVLQVVPNQAPQQGQGQARGQAGGGQAGRQGGSGSVNEMNPDGSAKNPAGLMAHIRGDQHMLASLQENNPKLAKAIRDEDISAFQEILRTMHRATQEKDRELLRLQELADADPLNIEVQAKIEELIQQKNIQESYENALEHAPELVVGQVTMLYVNMEVNGVPVKAFVDSGAQMSIMTQEFAEKCYLTRLIDKRFQGMAHGVGTSRIIGRIHQAPMRVGGHFIATPITVLEQKSGPQFIFGLDNLKRHQCSIDLRTNQLVFGSCHAKLNFLPESEIPSDFHQHVDDVSEEQAKKNMGAGASAAAGSSSAPAAPAPSTQAPGPAAPAPAATPAPAAAAAGVDSKVSKLMALGFSKEQCEAALRMAGGNEEYAAAVLFEQMADGM